MKARRFLIFVPALILALLLCGCLQTVVRLDIKSDLSADIDIKMGIDEDYYDMAGGDDAFSGIETGEAEGFTTEPYQADGYKGIETKGTVSDITESDTMLNEMFGDGFITTEEKDGKKTLAFRAPISGVQSQISGQSGYSLSELESFGKPDMRIIVTLPYNVIESNATGTSGNTLTWDLLRFEGTEMVAVCEYAGGFGFGGAGGGFPVWLLVVIIIAAAAVAAFLVLRYLKKKKTGGGPAPTANYAGYQTGAYVQQTQDAPVSHEPADFTEQPSGQPSAEPAQTMAFCPQCGAKLPDNSAFCPQCGHKLS